MCICALFTYTIYYCVPHRHTVILNKPKMRQRPSSMKMTIKKMSQRMNQSLFWTAAAVIWTTACWIRRTCPTVESPRTKLHASQRLALVRQPRLASLISQNWHTNVTQNWHSNVMMRCTLKIRSLFATLESGQTESIGKRQ